MTSAAEQKLHKKAADALVRWRRALIRENGDDTGPKVENGFDSTDEKLWEIAGEIMKHRGVHPTACTGCNSWPCVCEELRDAQESA